jgi:phytanoyl-CoA dioxygenase PhyH
MMNTIYYDSPFSDDVRRRHLFDGQLFVYSPRASTIAFCNFARTLIQEAFGTLDPQTAQHSLPVEQYAAILGSLKPKFIHHPESKEHIRNIFSDMGCDLAKSYFDVPKMRSSTSGNYLTTGIAYAWHPHRDTWYSAPDCQINWWIPMYEIESDNAMAFHPRYWSRPVRNTSNEYNYYQWNQLHRGDHVAQYLTEDPRPLPRPSEAFEREPEVRLVCPVGGIILFAAAQMHSSVPNTSGRTRFSIDFRTVHLDDVVAKGGAPNLDNASTGTVMRDYLRATDFSRLPEEIVALYDDGSGSSGELVYQDRGHGARG